MHEIPPILRQCLTAQSFQQLIERDAVSSEIRLALEYVASRKQKYPGLEFQAYKIREWFEKNSQVFFDCKDADKEACFKNILRETRYDAFTIFLVVKEAGGAFRLMDASFRNLGTETLERFIPRFHSQLEAMTKLGVQASGQEYVECIGHSYVEPSRKMTL